MRRLLFPLALALLVFSAGTRPLAAWGDANHQLVVRLALASLPADFPAWARRPEQADRLAQLSNTPDRWRNADPWLRQSGGSWSDHFIDIEFLTLAGLEPRAVPSLRYDFIIQYAAARMVHADRFPPLNAARNNDHTQQWPGFAPWAMAEHYHKLRSAFSYLRAYQDLDGTPLEIDQAQRDAIYSMGVLAHYIGDCAQPLHTTMHHDGWVGENPNGFTTRPGFHSWIDSGLAAKAGIGLGDLRPRVKPVTSHALTPAADGRDPFFIVAMEYILAQHAMVEPLYRLEKIGALGNGPQPVAPEGRAFVEAQLLKGTEMLARCWLTAWQTAPVDGYLRTQLAKRRAPATP